MATLLPEGAALLSYVVWLMLQAALGSICVSITLAAPFYVAAIVQRKFNQATREQYIIKNGGQPLPIATNREKVKSA